MAGFDYGRMQKTATRLLTRFAQGIITLTRVTPGTPDPETPWLPADPSVTTYELQATVAAVTLDQANAKYIDGTVITSSDLVVTCAAPPVRPQLGFFVNIGGVAQVIKKIVALPAAGTPVAYKLFVGGGAEPFDAVPPTDGPSLVFSIATNSQYIALLEDI